MCEILKARLRSRAAVASLLGMAWLLCVDALATPPQLITPQLSPATVNQSYSANLLVSSSGPVTGVVVSGLPTGLTATYNGYGSVAVAGTPTRAGSFSVDVSATDGVTQGLNIVATLLVNSDQVLPSVTSIAAGYLHSCAAVGGGVYCWGGNSAGEVGNVGSAVVPRPTAVIAAGSGVSAVGAGSYFSCALQNGGVLCWGMNVLGELGGGNSAYPFTPLQTIAAGSQATMISAGSEYACAVVNGGLQCWGSNQAGQLGINSRTDSHQPAQVFAPGSNVTAVAAGGNTTCAIVNGLVQCWGQGGFGGLGNGAFADSLVPTPLTGPASGATAIASGSLHHCAVVSGGVYCWGFNFNGQVGNTPTQAVATPLQVFPPGSGVTAVAAGGAFSCAVINGGVQCWGSNAQGQLGNNSALQSSTPVTVIPAGSNVSMITAGYWHACALAGSKMMCWGANGDGQIGDGRRSESFAPIQAIPAGSGATVISTVSSGYLTDVFSCAIVGGGVQCWGANIHGEFGNGALTTSGGPLQVIPANSNVTALSSGVGFVCAVVDGGETCWGANDAGRFGNGTAADSHTPASIIAPHSNVTAVAAGVRHSCVLINGGVVCSGDNGNGQLGNGTYVSSLSRVQAIAPGSGVTAIAANNHTCAIVQGGLQCWGRNNAGQLGNGTILDTAVPVQIFPAGSNITGLAVGDANTCIAIDGGVRCWGSNDAGQLGYSGSQPSPVPVQMIAAGSRVTAVAIGGAIFSEGHICALAYGGVTCWGNNFYGELGQPSYDKSLVPVTAIAPGSGVTAISAGILSSCAVVGGGAVCWGDGSYGMLPDAGTSPIRKPALALILAPQFPTTLRISTDASPSRIGFPVTLTAAVDGHAPTGTVAFKDNGAIIAGCDAVPLVSSVALCPSTFTTLGVHAINAEYSGDPNNAASSSSLPGGQVVQTGFSQTITFLAPSVATPTFSPGGTFTVRAFSTSGLTVRFSSLTSAICIVSQTGVVTMLKGGACTVAADQPGDDRFSAAPQATQNIAILADDQVITFPPIADVSLSAGSVELFGYSIMDAIVTFASATPAVCRVNGGLIMLLAVGTCTINANQAGIYGVNPAQQVSQSFRVLP